MKVGKLLDREQVVSHVSLIFILAAIQDSDLKSELAFINYPHIYLQLGFNIFTKGVIV